MKGKQLSFTTIGGATVSYNQRGKHYVEPRGYADHPGTGPVNETCGTCLHRIKFRRWNKCKLASWKWTGGRASDILAKAPACRLWEKWNPFGLRRTTVLTESEMLRLIQRKNR